jgi:hypothetical protein
MSFRLSWQQTKKHYGFLLILAFYHCTLPSSKIIIALLKEYTEASKITEPNGVLPLMMAIEHKLPYETMSAILAAYKDAASSDKQGMVSYEKAIKLNLSPSVISSLPGVGLS